MLENLTNWATDIVEQLGYIGVAMLVAIENLFPPIPSEVVLGLAGYTASRGDASVIGMIIAATVGSVVGAWVLYGLSAAVGPVRLRAVVIRYGTWIGFGETDLDRAEAWFDRRSRSAVLLCRCVPLLRSLISIPAGFRRMPLGTFTLFTLIGSLDLEHDPDHRRVPPRRAVGEAARLHRTVPDARDGPHRCGSSWRSSSARWC